MYIPSYFVDPHGFGENPSITRPTVTQFINELTEVEEQVSTSPSNSTNSGEVVNHRHMSRGITASTATKELDELMGKLSDFKMPPQVLLKRDQNLICTFCSHWEEDIR